MVAGAGTCEPEGFLTERKKGNVKHLAPGSTFKADFESGAYLRVRQQQSRTRSAH